MKDWEELCILQQLRQGQRQREMIARYVTNQRQKRYKLARIAQQRIIKHLERMGYEVHETTHNAPFDCWVGGCRVEIKASNWQEKANRYQGNIRHHKADILLFDAINGADHFFIIPMAEVKPRKTLEIYSYNVNNYQGQWSDYLESWVILDKAVADALPATIQLGFPNV